MINILHSIKVRLVSFIFILALLVLFLIQPMHVLAFNNNFVRDTSGLLSAKNVIMLNNKLSEISSDTHINIYLNFKDNKSDTGTFKVYSGVTTNTSIIITYYKDTNTVDYKIIPSIHYNSDGIGIEDCLYGVNFYSKSKIESSNSTILSSMKSKLNTLKTANTDTKKV